MTQQEIVINTLETLKTMLTKEYLKENYYSSCPNLFSRNRKISLPGIIKFILKKSMNSYDLRLSELQEQLDISDDRMPTKQAISKARGKIDCGIFKDIFKLSVEKFMKNNSRSNSWYGYQVYAIDGCDCEVPTTSATLEYFGDISCKKKRHSAGATTSTLTDVLNGIILDAEITHYKTNERSLAIQHCENVKELIDKDKTIIICDRGYPSYDFIGYLHDQNIKYVIRVRERLTKMRTPNTPDGEVYLKLRGKMRTVRAIEIELENKQKEYLITNLSKDEMEVSKFKELYFLRWKIEGKYQELKNRLHMEEFSGKTVNNIKQEYFACLFLSNLSAMMKNTVDQELKKEEGRDYKKYQANRSYITGCMNRIIESFLWKKVDLYFKINQLMKRAMTKRSLIRPNRKNERNKVLNRRKHHVNYKPCI